MSAAIKARTAFVGVRYPDGPLLSGALFLMCHCAVNSAHGGCAHVSSTHASVGDVSSGKHIAASGYPVLALSAYIRLARDVSEEETRSRQNTSRQSGLSAIAMAHVLHA